MAEPKGEKFILSLRELSGALADLGTLLPLMLGSIAVVGLAPTPVLAGFAVLSPLPPTIGCRSRYSP